MPRRVIIDTDPGTEDAMAILLALNSPELPTAMGTVIDRSLIVTQLMHVDVELRGEFTRAETVANRQNTLNRKVPRGDRLVFEGTDPLPPNTHVAMDIDAERFVDLLITRLAGK